MKLPECWQPRESKDVGQRDFSWNKGDTVMFISQRIELVKKGQLKKTDKKEGEFEERQERR